MRIIKLRKVPCRDTIGHGTSCSEDYMCEYCRYSLRGWFITAKLKLKRFFKGLFNFEAIECDNCNGTGHDNSYSFSRMFPCPKCCGSTKTSKWKGWKGL